MKNRITKRLLVGLGCLSLLLGLTSCFNTGPNELPTARFEFTPDGGYAPLEVELDASASSDPDGWITRYNWDFGDGETATGKKPTHTYEDDGDYTITLEVRDNRRGWDGKTAQIEVLNPPPVARFTISPEPRYYIGEEITFSAEDSYDPAGITTKSIETYEWDFGDGEEGTGKTTSHTYIIPDDYQVTLTITDDDGAQDTTYKDIKVYMPFPPTPG